MYKLSLEADFADEDLEAIGLILYFQLVSNAGRVMTRFTKEEIFFRQE